MAQMNMVQRPSSRQTCLKATQAKGADMAGFKHVIFDVDGTLADTDNISQRALQDLLFEWTGEEEDLKDLAFTRGIPGDEALARLGIFDKEVLARWDELAREHADEAKLFYEVREMLEELRKSGKKMGIVSSRRP